MSFLDIGSINRIASERNVRPHPLVDSLQLAAKTGYVNALAIAAFTGTGEIQKPVVESVRKVAIALGLSPTDGDDAITTIRGLSDSGERNRFFVEAIDSLPSREAALYYLCDFVRMSVEGEESDELLSALCGLFKNRISEADVGFIAEYKPYLRSDNIQGVSKMVQENLATDFELDHAILDYFTPGWNDEIKALPVRPQVRVCNGRFKVESVFLISEKNDAVFENAELIFSDSGSISIAASEFVNFRHCKFLVVGEKRTFAGFSLITGNDKPPLIFSDCEFDGGAQKCLIGFSGKVVFERCKFANWGNQGSEGIGSEVFSVDDATFSNCVFLNCATRGHTMFKVGCLKMDNCKFLNCRTKGRFFNWTACCRDFEIRQTIFKDCSTPFEVVHCEKSWKLIEGCGFYGCTFDNFDHRGLCDSADVLAKMHNDSTVIG